MSRSVVPFVILWVAMLLLVRPVGAVLEEAPTVSVPVTRLIENVQRYVETHPRDHEGFYALARLHGYAFTRGLTRLKVSDPGETGLPILPNEEPRVSRNVRAEPTSDELLHLTRSLDYYQKAARMLPKSACYWLGLGWMWEAGAPYAGAVVAPGRPARKRSTVEWREQALTAYRSAYSLDLKRDPRSGVTSAGNDTSIVLEAGEGILRLLDLKARTAEEQREYRSVTEAIAKLKSLPVVISPIIFPLERPVPLVELLASEQVVRFDLAADTRAEWWPWVSPQTGILVWDPQRTGRITSGAQLFGSRTWSMYWRDGYAPLAALDDDVSGWLSGEELAGLAVWCDRNGNAVSEKGEVRPLTALGITRVAVQASGSHAGVPFRERGLQREDGSYLPTYDWTPTSVLKPRKSSPP